MSRFVKSVAAGTGQTLPCTRELVFENTEPPQEPGNLQIALAKPPDEFPGRQRKSASSECDEQMYMVLEMMPNDRLTTFRLGLCKEESERELTLCFHLKRFVSQRPLPRNILEYLLASQEYLQHFSTPWN